ncbi:2OG-Fe(II) oxygenase [Janthinobacterium psychrotolerans]|uniref:SM-20-related protein n=1 Tax=Janthinobacterium psychrotolerans TaxID=1747903 RepID=A0A1A7BX93_9BURK|nr:2OG-Fe(II) oxygenase [Janthinobacterium psychrotolerans]OBV38137.1 SM-20-related protein [Janthinobacterium psychrotolerans]
MLTSPTACDLSFDELRRHGWSQHDGFLSPELARQLAAQCVRARTDGRMKVAGTGSGRTPGVHGAIRGDSIAWLEQGQSDACDQYLERMAHLRQQLNRELFLGLDDYESHFALYAPGAFYRTHLDRFRDDDQRTVSVVIYLNEGWLPAHGGALRLHPEGEASLDILPEAGRMVMFLSAEMLHEVLPTARERLSLAGWLRRRA